MKVLDRYLIREVIVPTLYFVMTLTFLILIADLFDNLDEMLKNRAPFLTIVQYYLALTPIAFTETIAWAVWLGAMFLLVNFGIHNETTAMKAAGIKITTIVRPVVFLGFLIGIATFLISDRIVPRSAKIAAELRQVHIEKKNDEESGKVLKNVTYYSGKNQLTYFRTFSKVKNEVEGAVILWMGDGPLDTRRKMTAQVGRWRSGEWEFDQVTEYLMDSRGRIFGEPQTSARKKFPEMTFTPKELAAASSEIGYLSYRELKNTIEKLTEYGLRVHSESVDLHYRLAAPWQGLVMILITIPFLARTTNRKLIALNVLFCVGVIFAFHVGGAVSLALGKKGTLLPFLSAWGGNILFATGALVYLDRANY